MLGQFHRLTLKLPPIKIAPVVDHALIPGWVTIVFCAIRVEQGFQVTTITMTNYIVSHSSSCDSAFHY